MTSKCPCVDCITLAICKAEMQEKFAFAWLRGRCSLFGDYYDYRYINPDELEKIFLLKLFKPLHWETRVKHPEGVSI